MGKVRLPVRRPGAYDVRSVAGIGGGVLVSGPYDLPKYGWRRIRAGRYETTNLIVGHNGGGWWVVQRKDNDRLLARETHLMRAKRAAITIEHLKALQDKRDEAGNE